MGLKDEGGTPAEGEKELPKAPSLLKAPLVGVSWLLEKGVFWNVGFVGDMVDSNSSSSRSCCMPPGAVGLRWPAPPNGLPPGKLDSAIMPPPDCAERRYSRR